MLYHIVIRETCINGMFVSKVLGLFESRRQAEETCIADRDKTIQESDKHFSRDVVDTSYNNFSLELWKDDNYDKWKIVTEEPTLINYQDYDGYLNSLSDEEFKREMEENDADSKLQEFEDMHYLY